jgi:antitoxin ParD1/3/4
MGHYTFVSLGDYFESFADGLVKAGRFKNVSEVIRAGLLFTQRYFILL